MAKRVSVPSITTEQMREVDRLMIEEYGIVLLQMMENAGRNLAQLAASLAGGAPGRHVLVLAGKGNNGGGGLVAARHASNMGSHVRVLLTAAADELTDTPAHQASILRSMGIELLQTKATSPELLPSLFAEADLIIDALIGYSLAGAPLGQAAALIELANASGKPIVSLDVPSGVDAGSGRVYEPSIRAVATLTLALPKTGLAGPDVRGRLGELYLADLSVPPALYHRLGLELGPLFARGSVVRLHWAKGGWVSEG
ncbi:MAG: NAD(P)H-hydrate epimerase [Dehalococcoidia bacterium]